MKFAPEFGLRKKSGFLSLFYSFVVNSSSGLVLWVSAVIGIRHGSGPGVHGRFHGHVPPTRRRGLVPSEAWGLGVHRVVSVKFDVTIFEYLIVLHHCFLHFTT